MTELRHGAHVRARYANWRDSGGRNAMARVVLAQRPRTCDCCVLVIGHGELYLSVNAFNTESVCQRCVDAGRCTIDEGGPK